MIITQQNATKNDIFLLSGATVINGKGAAPFVGDVKIEGDSITAVDNTLHSNDESMKRIDCRGLYLAPAFIDPHTHTDAAPFLPQGFRPKITQGIATETVGVCGLGIAPMPKERQASWRKTLVIGNPDISWSWETTAQWYDAVEKAGLECNVLPFVGHGTLRYAAAGGKSAPLSPKEEAKMLDMLEEAFDAGAVGTSLGLIYFPALFASRNELLAVAKKSAEYGRLLAVHMRSESDELFQALREIIDIAEEAGCRLHISHLKAIGERNQRQIPQVLRFIEQKGLSFDSYPYDFGSTSLLSLLPPFLLEGTSIEGAIGRLGDAETIQRLEALYGGAQAAPSNVPWDNLPLLLGWNNIVVSDLPGVSKKKALRYTGKSIARIAEEEQSSPLAALGLLLAATEGAGRMLDRYSREERVEEILLHPAGMLSSDTLLGGRLHPRVYGTFSRFFRWQVFETSHLSLEEAVRKSSKAAADLFGIKDRALIAPNKKADIVVFDSNITDCSSTAFPEKESEGIHWLFINGKVKIADGHYLSEKSGRLIRTCMQQDATLSL